MAMRYLPAEPLPTLAYVPGRDPRPPPPVERRSFSAELWREDDAYLWGVDLYDAGFAWEAHEAWESAWRGASGAQRELFQGLIQCAAACVKIASGDTDAAIRLANKAASHLAALGTIMGLDAPAFVREVVAWAEARPAHTGDRPLISLPLHRVLSTERLNVRELAEDDLDALASICADAETMRFVDDGEPMTRERVEKMIARANESYRTRPHGFGPWAVCSRAHGGLVGYAGVVYPEGEPELIYTLDRSHWGSGLGSEVARAVLDYALDRVPRVVATVDPRHVPSLRILRGLGFVHERTGVDEHGLPTEWWSVVRSPRPVETRDA